jgi:pyruvate dehydrogenase phosphatase
LYNLHPGFHNSSPWEHFLSLNRSPPYVSSDAEVAHRRLHGRQRLVLCTDGLADISHQDDPVQAAKEWGWIIKEAGSSVKALDRAKQGSNMAADLLYQVLGGEDVDSVARALTLELEEPWFDDVTIIVLSL